MISFIIPFSTIEKDKFLNLNEKEDLWKENYYANIIYSTLKTIKNISSLKCEKEILLIDNSRTWDDRIERWYPDITLPNVRVIKGWQALPLEELKKIPEYMNHKDIQASLDNLGCLTMWVSIAFHQGIQEAKGEYVVLQHNDTFYNQDCIDEMTEHMKEEELEYISVDNKKIWISTYLLHKKMLDKYIKSYSAQIVQMRPESGGCVRTIKLGFADAYFFLCKRNFFDNYNIDWRYGDTNHGATIYCLENNLKYLHLGPYYDNPNWETEDKLHTYYYKDEPFLTHLKGGFSEGKMSLPALGAEYSRYMEEMSNIQIKEIKK